MTRYDVTPDDEPVDVAAVGADDALVERLRRALTPEAAVVWDDDDDTDDPGYALLRALQRDVDTALPNDDLLAAEGLPLPDVVRSLPRTRRLSRGATLAAVAASVLSIGGVAAASAPGQPLAGVRSAVASAVTSVVGAITPDEPVGPQGADAARPTPSPTPPGKTVSAAARDAAAVQQIRANLDRASVLLDAQRWSAAKAQLDAAARKLVLVTDPPVRAALADELAALRTRLAAPHPAATHGRTSGHPAADGSHGRRPSDSSTAGTSRSTRATTAPTAPAHGTPTGHAKDSGTHGTAPTTPALPTHATAGTRTP